jgi:hypothetical protein
LRQWQATLDVGKEFRGIVTDTSPQLQVPLITCSEDIVFQILRQEVVSNVKEAA